MIGHEDIGVNDAPMHIGPLLEPVKIGRIVFITKEHRLEAVSTLNYIGGNARQIESGFTLHRDIFVIIADLHCMDCWIDKGNAPLC